ncbi:MAG TPA: riboflavin biosynthesis protein RibF [Burkholderiales bacterium]|nr:riboflavin biosynthesis protein RibF [Burkholderiales bacterium]
MYKILLNPDIVSLDSAVVTIGNFDGLHLGHLELFKTLNIVAKKYNYKRVAITFEPLPLEHFSDIKKEERLSRLSLLRDKFLLLKKNDLIDELVVLHFNSRIANLSPKAFIKEVLLNKLNTSHVVIGHDFKFGKNGGGKINDFVKLGLEITLVEPFCINTERISSSIIRNLATKNDLTLIRNYLGHNLQYTSRVIHGKKLGRKLGVPTINLSLGRNKPALWGIYTAYIYIDNKRYNAVASIGKNPTVSDLDTYKLEGHLLDVDLDLYGKIATIEILGFIRDELKFNDIDSLIRQMQKDLQQARAYFKEN